MLFRVNRVMLKVKCSNADQGVTGFESRPGAILRIVGWPWPCAEPFIKLLISSLLLE